jgi:hypothetical protein
MYQKIRSFIDTAVKEPQNSYLTPSAAAAAVVVVVVVVV